MSEAAAQRPDPVEEIRMLTLHATRGANYWSRFPVTRMDLSVGAYEDISSGDVAGFTECLVRTMPGLAEHRCSIGEPGGFIIRLRRGTYPPHIIEHVALELQNMIGHDVAYGRTRGGDVEGEYTLVFEHLHEAVGLRAAALALEVVQRALAGKLENVDGAVAELRALAETPDTPPLHQRVFCAITGGSARPETQAELQRRLRSAATHVDPDPGTDEPLVVDVSPAFLLQAGLPYSRSRVAIVLDAEPQDVPERYRDPERARRLVSTLADGVARGGLLVCPADEWDVQDEARERGCRVAVFARPGDHVTRRDLKVALSFAELRDGRIWLEHCGDGRDGGELLSHVSPVAQLAAALTLFALDAPAVCADAVPARDVARAGRA